MSLVSLRCPACPFHWQALNDVATEYGVRDTSANLQARGGRAIERFRASGMNRRQESRRSNRLTQGLLEITPANYQLPSQAPRPLRAMTSRKPR